MEKSAISAMKLIKNLQIPESEIKLLEEEVQSLKVENKRLKEEIIENEKELAKVNMIQTNTKAERLETKEKLDISQDINDSP